MTVHRYARTCGAPTPDERYQLARSAVEGHLNECSQCRAANLSGAAQPCDAGIVLAGDVLDAGTAVRDARRANVPSVGLFALLLAFLVGLLGFGGYWLVDDAARHWGPMLAPLWGG